MLEILLTMLTLKNSKKQTLFPLAAERGWSSAAMAG